MLTQPTHRLAAILVSSVLIHFLVSARTHTLGDLQEYRAWTRTLAIHGLVEAYWPEGPDRRFAIDYPPAIPYVLLGVGRLVRLADPTVLAGHDEILDLFIQAPFIGGTVLLAGCIFAALRQRGHPNAAVSAAALIALNPASLFHTAYWGQTDSLWTTLVVLTSISLDRRRPGTAWLAIGASVLVKPLAAPFIPLWCLLSWKRFGARTLVRGLATAVGVIGVCLLPFALEGRLRPIVDRSIAIDAMPFASVNAHNLWWLVTGGLPWTPSNEKAIGPFSYTVMGLALFAIWYVMTVRSSTRSEEPLTTGIAAASVAFGFFILSTHMHENHSYALAPLILLARGEDSRWRSFAFVVSLAFLANMALHDPYLRYAARSVGWGPMILLREAWPSNPDPSATLRDFPALIAEMRGHKSMSWLVLTWANAQVMMALFVIWASSTLARPLRVGATSRPVVVWVITVAVASAAVFVARTAPLPRWPRSAESLLLSDLSSAPTPTLTPSHTMLLQGGDLLTTPPAVATYRVETAGRPVSLFFTPEVQGGPTDRRTRFQVRVDGRLLYDRDHSAEPQAPVRLQFESSRADGLLSMTLITTPDSETSAHEGTSTWRDVVVVVGSSITP